MYSYRGKLTNFKIYAEITARPFKIFGDDPKVGFIYHK